MKKIILVICLFVFFLQPAWADYKPIPKELSKQYKNEIENLINNRYYSTQQQIDTIYIEAKNMYYKVKYDNDLYIDFATKNYDTNIFIPVFDLLADVISITQKYTEIEEYTPATDFTGVLYDFCLPYFYDNHISISKIDKLSKYARNKQIKIEKYYEKAHKLIYPNDNY